MTNDPGAGDVGGPGDGGGTDTSSGQPAAGPEPWAGELAARPGPEKVAQYQAFIGSAPNGGSGAFRARTDQGLFWVKPLNNQQSPRVTVNEFVIARVGALIGAPVCSVRVVEIAAAMAGDSFGTAGKVVEAGQACGSEHIGPNVEHKGIQHLDKVDNAQRYAGIRGLYDWGFGDDGQWLYAESESEAQRHRMHSHDHGHYLPGGPNWTPESLTQNVDVEHRLPHDLTGADADALDDTARRLRDVEHGHLVEVLRAVPPTWPVSQVELEALGWFLERRAGPVADRLNEDATTVRGGAAA